MEDFPAAYTKVLRGRSPFARHTVDDLHDGIGPDVRAGVLARGFHKAEAENGSIADPGVVVEVDGR